MKNFSLTVSELNEYVRKTLAADPMLHGLCITGEISNFKFQSSGHWYFTLKDEESAIACVMFRSAAQNVIFKPENGQRVRLFGGVGMYAKTGTYQFYGEFMEQDGLGDLYVRFEALKRKLSLEGLFDPSLKKPIPFLPRGIGIITSPTGAVVHDIEDVSHRRFPGMPLYLFPTKVQGDGAAQEIAEAIKRMDRFPLVDVLIVARGGGSMEDLWPFNEECTARAIAACHLPVISAVGHETDFTISDFAADLRAPTPSAAAEIAVPMKTALQQQIRSLREELLLGLDHALTQKRLSLQKLQKRIASASPVGYQERMRSALQVVEGRIQTAARFSIASYRHDVEKYSRQIKSSGLSETLSRGYALVTDLSGNLISGTSDVFPSQEIRIRLHDGTLNADVKTMNPLVKE